MESFQENFKKDFEEWNNKPFDTKELLNINEPFNRSRYTEIAIKILVINEYISTRLQQRITKEGFTKFLKDELKKLNIIIPDSEMVNLKVALLNLSGIYAYYVILWKRDSIKTLDLIQNYELNKEAERKSLEKIEKALDEMEIYKAKLLKEEDQNKLQEILFEQFKIIINNKGESLIVYHLIDEWFELAKQKLNVSKYKLCGLISECFYFFEFISKSSRINYPESLYKQLNRIKNKEEKIQRLTELFEQFTFHFPSL